MNIDELIDENNKHVGGWCLDPKQRFLAEIVQQRDLQNMVEIGVWQGKSLIPMAWGCKQKGSGKIIAIDAYDVAYLIENGGDEHPSYYAADQNENEQKFLQNLKRFEVEDFVTYEGPQASLQAAKKYKKDEFDLIHIDANHSEINSLQDFYSWFPKLKIGGVLVLDDTDRTQTIKLRQQATELCSKILEDQNQWMALQK
jgi:predicted O-methyltransferase YrrM